LLKVVYLIMVFVCVIYKVTGLVDHAAGARTSESEARGASVRENKLLRSSLPHHPHTNTPHQHIRAPTAQLYTYSKFTWWFVAIGPPRTPRDFSPRHAHGSTRVYANDPSAGSPTETLLRLLLPLNDQV
jgi:hypothetical protein